MKLMKNLRRWTNVSVMFALSAIMFTLPLAGAQSAQRFSRGVLIHPIETAGGCRSEVIAINERGQVIGTSYSADGRLLRGFLWDKGVMTDLGALGSATLPVAFNERGQVVGYSWDSEETVGPGTAFLWEGGVLTGIAGPPGSPAILDIIDINERGQVLGHLPGHPFVWQKGVMTPLLGALGGLYTTATAINDHGQIVGYSETATGDAHAFLWHKGKIKDLDTLGSGYSRAIAINNQGQVVGVVATSSGSYHAFRWQKGRMSDLGALGYSDSEPIAINARGQIMGSLGTQNVFFWEEGEMTDIGTLGFGTAQATSMNDRGQIVGLSQTVMGDSSGFLWHDGVMNELLTPLPDQRRFFPAVINNRGQMAGRTDLCNLILWTPTRARH
jgi:probable HAF family extracellular repeat protein